MKKKSTYPADLQMESVATLSVHPRLTTSASLPRRTYRRRERCPCAIRRRLLPLHSLRGVQCLRIGRPAKIVNFMDFGWIGVFDAYHDVFLEYYLLQSCLWVV